MSQRECALLDYERGMVDVDWKLLRTTAIDGWSERLRFGVGKKIKNTTIIAFLREMYRSGVTPHMIRLFNIIGYPTETVDDWRELVDVFREADQDEIVTPNGNSWHISIQNNHFLPYPATPMACAPIKIENYRGTIRQRMGIDLPKCRIYDGHNVVLSVSETVEALPTVLLNAIALRGTQRESAAIRLLCGSKKFWSSDTKTRQLTLEKYFDLPRICGRYTPDTLPTRWLHTWAKVEKAYGRTPLEVQ